LPVRPSASFDPTQRESEGFIGFKRAAHLLETALLLSKADAVKAGLYARAEIAEYWVVDIPNRCLHVHTDPQNGQYQSVIVHPATATVAPTAAPNAAVTVSQLLP
jgi:hypothetical protein